MSAAISADIKIRGLRVIKVLMVKFSTMNNSVLFLKHSSPVKITPTLKINKYVNIA